MLKRHPFKKYESSEIVNIKIESIKKLCDIFSISPNFLIGNDSNQSTYEEYEKETTFFNLIQYFFGEKGVVLIKNYTNFNEKRRKKSSTIRSIY